MENTLRIIRARGWRVAVHNDYRASGADMTFWLFTSSESGQYVKGEAATDAKALRLCLERIRQIEDVDEDRPL